jgi:threonine dehydratase
MSDLTLTYAGVDYLDRTRTLVDGTTRPAGISLRFISLPPNEVFRRVAQHTEFDAAEMSISTFMNLVSRGDARYVGIPVFPSRNFRHGYVFVHPFDDPQIIAGAGTLALEMLEAVPTLDTLVIPIGGGGLISGSAIAAKSINPRIEVIGVEAELYPSMKNVVEGQAGKIGGDTLAEGIAVKEPGELTRAIIKEKVDAIDLVAERDIEHAVALLVSVEKSVVEGAGAAGLANILADPARFRGRTVGTVLCGGNIDTHLLANVLVRELVRCGRIARLKIAAHDQPGALAAITAKFHECGVNIIEVSHHRIFTRLPAKDTVIEVECEARDSRAIDTLVRRLEDVGFQVDRAELD